MFPKGEKIALSCLNQALTKSQTMGNFETVQKERFSNKMKNETTF